MSTFGRETVAQVATQISDAVSAGKDQVALRLFIQIADNLAAVSEGDRRRLSIESAPFTGEPHWDAAVAGLVAYRTQGEVQPPWIHERHRYLADPWTFGSRRYDLPIERARVPIQFLERNVLIDLETLISI